MLSNVCWSSFFVFVYANVTEKAMAVEDVALMSAAAPACRRAASVPSGCRPRRASGRNLAPPLDFCWVGICRDLMKRKNMCLYAGFTQIFANVIKCADKCRAGLLKGVLLQCLTCRIVLAIIR